MATEKLYRRGAYGIMEEVVPEAKGKAAAFDRWLAQGGTPFRASGRFKQGPMKGLTYDQAKQKFESMWASAPDAIKEKYAGRSKTDLAPSERKIQGIEPTPKDMSPEAVQRRRMASYGHEFDATGVAVPIKRQMSATPARTATVKQPAQTSFAPGSDAAREAALTANSRNELFATADNGDQTMKAAIAMRDNPNAVPSTYPGEVMAEAGRRNNRPASAVLMDMANGSMTQEARDAAEAARVSAETTRFNANSEDRVRRGLPALDPRSTDDRVRAGKVVNLNPPVPPANVQPVGSVITPPLPAPPTKTTATRPTAPTGQPIMGDAPRGVNRLTGLPFGHLPGDALPNRFAGDAAMKERAAASVERQKTAPVITAGAPRAIPVLQPKPPTFEQRMRVTPGPKIANPDDPKKFFTGRTLPLDQLVDPSKRPSSGYQVGGAGPSGGRVLSIRPARR